MSNLPPVDRRRFLTGSLAAATVAAASPGLLSACSTPTSAGKNTTKINQSVQLPTYMPYAGVHPDLPGDTQGLLDGFLSYPASPLQAFTAAPASGGAVSGFVQTALPVPPSAGQNKYWQQLNAKLGVTLSLTIVPTADWPAKFATLVAGGSGGLPDIIEPATALPNGLPAGINDLPAWLAAECQDLSEFLAGDAIKEYPFLANLPTASWRELCVYNGGIYGLPTPRGVAGTLMFRRDDIFGQLGVNPNPASFAEFHSMARQVTDPKKNRWAFAQSPTGFIQNMLGVPNATPGWILSSGKLTAVYETELIKQALSDAAQMVKEGLVHPGSFDPGAPTKLWFNAGNALLTADRYTGWPQYYAQNVAGPGFDIGGMRPPLYNGGGFAPTTQSQAGNNFTALKKAGKTRIKQLLAICNWLAAPFGTQEYLFRKFGIVGTDYTLHGSSPILTQTGVTETALGIRYIVDAPDVLFVPGQPQATRKAYDYQASIIPISVKDPTFGLFSNAWSTKQAALSLIINTSQNDILQGRAPVSSWSDTVKAWQQAGGNQVRTEYEQQLAKAGGSAG